MTPFQVATSKASTNSTSKLSKNQRENPPKEVISNQPKSFVFSWKMDQTFQKCTDNKNVPIAQPFPNFLSIQKQLKKCKIGSRTYSWSEDSLSSSKKATIKVLYFLGRIGQASINQSQTKIDTLRAVHDDSGCTLASKRPLGLNKIQRMGCNKKWQEIITDEILLCWAGNKDSSNRQGRVAPARKEGFHRERKEDRAKD